MEEEKYLSSKKFSEAIHTITPDLTRLVRQRMFHPHMELECLLLIKQDMGRLSNNIPEEKFDVLLRALLKTHAARIATTSDNEKWLATEDRFYLNGRLRETIVRNSVTGLSESVWLQKDSLDRKIFVIPQLPYGFCISVKREKPLTTAEAQEFLAQKGEMSFLRNKSRFSIWWSKKPFRTDFTLVHSASSKKRLQAEATLIASYQGETEFVSDVPNLELCHMTQEDFINAYDMNSPLITPAQLRAREKKVAAELMEISLRIPQVEKITTLSLNSYPEALYVGGI